MGNKGKDGDQVMAVSGSEIASTTPIEQTDCTEVASERDSKDQEENKTETEVKAVTSDVRADEGIGGNVIEGIDTSEKDGQVVNKPSSPQTPSTSWTDATDASSPQIPRDDDDCVQEIPFDQEILPPKKGYFVDNILLNCSLELDTFQLLVYCTLIDFFMYLHKKSITSLPGAILIYE